MSSLGLVLGPSNFGPGRYHGLELCYLVNITKTTILQTYFISLFNLKQAVHPLNICHLQNIKKLAVDCHEEWNTH